MIAGQSPRLHWQANPAGALRSIEDAVEIARTHGVAIPDDVAFLVDELDELSEDCTARGPRIDKPTGSLVHWSDLVHDLTGKVPFRVWEGILTSDEAIVAVLGHEMYELEQLRPILEAGATTIEQFIALTCPGNPGNLHDEAWDFADELVTRMREPKP